MSIKQKKVYTLNEDIIQQQNLQKGYKPSNLVYHKILKYQKKLHSFFKIRVYTYF